MSRATLGEWFDESTEAEDFTFKSLKLQAFRAKSFPNQFDPKPLKPLATEESLGVVGEVECSFRDVGALLFAWSALSGSNSPSTLLNFWKLCERHGKVRFGKTARLVGGEGMLSVEKETCGNGLSEARLVVVFSCQMCTRIISDLEW